MSSNPSPSSSVSDTRPTSIVVSEVDTNTGAVGAQSEATLIEPPTASNAAPSNSSAPSAMASDDFSNLAALRKSVPDLATGQMFGRYRIECLLGRGGMGAVYRAYDTNLQRTVALKVPFFKKGHSDEIVKRFLREARAVAQLSHPNL